MKQWIRSGTLLCLMTFVSVATVEAQFGGGPPCERSNHALLKSNRQQAQADFWLSVAESLVDPTGHAGPHIQQAYAEWHDANLHAQQVFAARESACALLGHEIHAPQVVPTQFTTLITNPYAPVKAGLTLVRERETAAGIERIETSMSDDIQLVGGVACSTVRERESIGGVLVEDTRNWIAQHENGAVWYFGEVEMSFSDGVLDSLEGSWRYGNQGALPGILAPLSPAVGDVYRQEYWFSRAEDLARVVQLDATVVVPAGTFTHCLVIEEWDPLEPFEYFLSFIAPNVGVVLEIDLQSGARSELVEIRS